MNARFKWQIILALLGRISHKSNKLLIVPKTKKYLSYSWFLSAHEDIFAHWQNKEQLDQCKIPSDGIPIG